MRERERVRHSIPYTKGDCCRVSSTLSSKLRMKKVPWPHPVQDVKITVQYLQIQYTWKGWKMFNTTLKTKDMIKIELNCSILLLINKFKKMHWIFPKRLKIRILILQTYATVLKKVNTSSMHDIFNDRC